MIRFLVLISFLVSSIGFSQSQINYEFNTIRYFLDSIENRRLFKASCDCAKDVYNTKQNLVVYDSSYYRANLELVLPLFDITLSKEKDSLNRLQILSAKLNLSGLDPRITMTTNPKDFGMDHYLIRFSQRIHYRNWTFVGFNIKSSRQCSGVDYYFLFTESGIIEKTKRLIWCDAQG